jgi:DNA topoisomerase-1
MKLVIVESPAKCSKIQSFLGDGYKVVATMGHIRALEEKLTSVGIDNNWTATYKELVTKKDAIAKLRAAAKGAEVILASDDDREGEGIAWHVCHILKLNPATTPRIVFHEITKPAIQAAVANPRRLDMNKVNAQQARAMLDLLVGFTISKVLWARVAPKLSAGRCQTPALRLVVERDAEVENHKSAAFWRLRGTIVHSAAPTHMLDIQAANDVPTQDQATAVLNKVHANPNAKVTSVKESISTSQAPKPFITSTLQQEASASHGLNPKSTMMAAQKLYEAGHITYMRTDNPQLSLEAAAAIRDYVTKTHGSQYVGPDGQHTMSATSPTTETTPKPKAKAKKTDAPATPEAQAAHEAIRPTHPETPNPTIDDATQRTVYNLIWRRATQSQMAASTTDVRKATIVLEAEPDRIWNAEMTKSKFQGYKILEAIDPVKADAEVKSWATWTPLLVKDAILNWKTLHADEAFTKPKGRFTEASLIAELEKRGIGRPSTFASLVSTIIDREYVEKTNVEGKAQDSHHLTIIPKQWPPSTKTESHKVGAEKNKMRSTALGRAVSQYLNLEYNNLFNYEFTAKMEQSLDQIAQGQKEYKTLLQQTWDTYKDKYNTQMAIGSKESKAARERILSPGVKVILSGRGPLFVRDPPEGSPKTTKATFAALPPTVSFETATAADAESAFVEAAAAKAGELIGALEGQEIRKKKGPYGLYAECGTARVPLKGDELLEQIQEKLKAKISFAATGEAFTRVVGEFTIKKGPYGLYMYKTALKLKRFVSFPATSDAEKVDAKTAATLYSEGLAKKKKWGGKPKDKPAAT